MLRKSSGSLSICPYPDSQTMDTLHRNCVAFHGTPESNFSLAFFPLQGQLRPEKITGEVWSTVFHKYYGLCHTFSLKRAKDLELDNAITLSFLYKPSSVFPFFFAESGDVGVVGSVLLHSGNDLPDSEIHSSILEFYPLNLAWQTEYTIAKTKFKVEPTKKNPCGDLYPDSCHDLNINNFAEEKYACYIPWLNTGNHTQQNQSLPICRNVDILNVLEIREGLKKSCKSVKPCQHSRYRMMSENIRILFFDVSMFNKKLSPLPKIISNAGTRLHCKEL